ncbi:MAG: hypothetical protein QNK92_04380 [Amylibacter sp.]
MIGGARVEMAALPVGTANGTAKDVPDLGAHTAAVKREFGG